MRKKNICQFDHITSHNNTQGPESKNMYLLERGGGVVGLSEGTKVIEVKKGTS